MKKVVSLLSIGSFLVAFLVGVGCAPVRTRSQSITYTPTYTPQPKIYQTPSYNGNSFITDYKFLLSMDVTINGKSINTIIKMQAKQQVTTYEDHSYKYGGTMYTYFKNPVQKWRPVPKEGTYCAYEPVAPFGYFEKIRVNNNLIPITRVGEDEEWAYYEARLPSIPIGSSYHVNPPEAPDEFHLVKSEFKDVSYEVVFSATSFKIIGGYVKGCYTHHEEYGSTGIVKRFRHDVSLYRLHVDDLKVRRIVNEEINSKIKNLTIDVMDRNSHSSVQTQLTISTPHVKNKHQLVEEVFAGKTNDFEVLSVAKQYVNNYLDKEYSKWGSHFEFGILAPATVNVKSINKAYHYVEGSFKVTEDAKKAIFLTDIGQKLRVEQTKEGEGGFVVDNN